MISGAQLHTDLLEETYAEDRLLQRGTYRVEGAGIRRWIAANAAPGEGVGGDMARIGSPGRLDGVRVAAGALAVVLLTREWSA